MCFESMDNTFYSITTVGIGGDKLILGPLGAFDHFFVGSARFIVYDLEVNIVAAACQPFRYGVVRHITVFVAAHF